MSNYSDLNEAEIERIIKKNYQQKKISWDALTFSQKFNLFNKWSIVSTIANLSSFYGSFFLLLSTLFNY